MPDIRSFWREDGPAPKTKPKICISVTQGRLTVWQGDFIPQITEYCILGRTKLASDGNPVTVIHRHPQALLALLFFARKNEGKGDAVGSWFGSPLQGGRRSERPCFEMYTATCCTLNSVIQAYLNFQMEEAFRHKFS